MAPDVTVKVIDVTKPIERGSIIVVVKDSLTPGAAGPLMAELSRIAGHDQFLIMECPEDGSIGVHGPNDLVEALKRLAKEKT